MNNNGKIVRVSILGNEYPIRSTVEDETYVRAIASYVDQKMREIEKSMQPTSPARVAILAALNIADELFAERKDRQQVTAKCQQKLQLFNETLDQELDE